MDFVVWTDFVDLRSDFARSCHPAAQVDRKLPDSDLDPLPLVLWGGFTLQGCAATKEDADGTSTICSSFVRTQTSFEYPQGRFY